jgi:hypothetical protein
MPQEVKCNRREMMRGVAGLLLGGSVMLDEADHPDLKSDRVMERAFRMAAAFERDHRSFSTSEFLPTDRDIPTLTGLKSQIGPVYRDLYYFFQPGSTGCFADHAVAGIERIRRCLKAGYTDWRPVERTLKYLWQTFFGGPAVARDWPGFVILMPDGYVTSRHNFLQKGEQTKIPRPEIVKAIEGTTLTLEFGRLWSKFDIPIVVQSMPLRVPAGRDRKWARPVVRHRVRFYVGVGGRRLPSETIFQLGRADPDDEGLLQAGHYYPNTEGKRILGVDGSVCFTRGMTVLVLARLVPNPSPYSAVIHQMCISIGEYSNDILDINCLTRSFPQFAKHYPGIENLISESLGL